MLSVGRILASSALPTVEATEHCYAPSYLLGRGFGAWSQQCHTAIFSTMTCCKKVSSVYWAHYQTVDRNQ